MSKREYQKPQPTFVDIRTSGAKTTKQFRKRIRELYDALQEERHQRMLSECNPKPIPMLLFCPSCGARHIDAGIYASLAKPHHTHACQECGMCWRPAIVHTVGVQFLPGFKDEVE